MKAKYQSIVLAMLTTLAISALGQTPKKDYTFKGGYPTLETAEAAYDDSDLNRAIDAYKLFYPPVSFSAGVLAMEKSGVKVNSSAAFIDARPRQLVFTANSDTPYAVIPRELKEGPIVVELPPGQLMCVV